MESIKKLKIISEKIKEKFGFKFYTKPQNYKVLYKVEIKNLLNAENQINVILPIPPNTDYQKLGATPKFSLLPAAIGFDEKFKNQFAWWRIAIKPHGARTIQQEFEIIVYPRIFKYLQFSAVGAPNAFGAPTAEKNIYLQSNKYLQTEHPQIKRLARGIAGKEKNILKIVQKINDYVINYLTYGKPIKGLYSATDALEKKEVDCGGFSALLIGLCMALKIPSRIIAGFWAGYKKNQMHAWCEFQLSDGQWIPCDPTIQHLSKQGRSFKSGEFGFVGSDRIAFSFGCDLSLEIENQTINPVRNEISNGINVDILQNPLVWSENKEKSFEIETEFTAEILRSSTS